MSEPAEVGTEALDLLTMQEVAARLRLSYRQVQRLVAAEREVPGSGLGSVRVGRAVRVPPESVAEYKHRLKTGAV